MVWWFFFILTLAILLKWFNVRTCGVCRSSARLEGKVAIVTGSDRGIGYATAEELARRGARVLLACVDDAVARRARDSIVAITGNRDVLYLHLDLGSLASVRAFAARVLSAETRLDILVNNAGVAFQGQKRTPDGLIAEAQINHFGPFLLTNLLLPLLETSAPSRIVNVVSVLHWFGSTDFGKLDRKIDSNVLVYCNTKLANILFTKELSRRLEGTGVVVNAAYPGFTQSNIYASSPLPLRLFSSFYNNVFFKTAKEGAQTSIQLAVAPECGSVSGQYFMDCKPASCSPQARDVDKAKELWHISANAVKLDEWKHFKNDND